MSYRLSFSRKYEGNQLQMLIFFWVCDKWNISIMLTVSLKTEYEMVLIKLNMVLGLKFLRLYIFFLQRWILYIQFRNCTYGIMKGVIWSSKHNAFVKIVDWFFSRELCSLCPCQFESCLSLNITIPEVDIFYTIWRIKM